MLKIRPADDITIVQALWRDYWRELGLSDEFQGFEQELGGLPGKYAPPRGRLLIAERQGICAGTIALRPLTAEDAEVKRLYVRPELRGRGIGRQLLEFLIGEAKSLGYGAIYCDTLPSMTGPIHLYCAMGFRILDHPYSSEPTPGAVYLGLNL